MPSGPATLEEIAGTMGSIGACFAGEGSRDCEAPAMEPEGRRHGTDALDGLRGIAIALVVFYHSWLFSWVDPHVVVFGRYLHVEPLAAVGFLGVDLFFFVSGFCLFHPHVRTMLAGAPVPGTRHFFTRRALKIVPSYLLALVPAAIVARPYYSTSGEWWRSLAVHVAFLHNLYVDWIGQVNGVFWSLAIEVQFYALFPVIAWAFRRRPLIAFLTLAALAQAYRIHTLGFIDDEPRVRVLAGYLDVFATGMFAAYALEWLRRRRPAWTTGRLPAAWTAVAIAAAWGLVALMLDLRTAIDAPHGREIWQVWHRGELALLTFALALGTQLGAAWWRAAIVNPFTVWMSVLSYNLYLWHGGIEAWMFRYGLPHARTANPHADPAWGPSMLPIALGVSLAVALAVTYFFERPILGLGKPIDFAFRRPRRTAERRELRPAPP